MNKKEKKNATGKKGWLQVYRIKFQKEDLRKKTSKNYEKT